jgi:hypothetical protein
MAHYVIPAQAEIRAPVKAHKQHSENPCWSMPQTAVAKVTASSRVWGNVDESELTVRNKLVSA